MEVKRLALVLVDRQFEEVAGEDVTVVHRLLKNTVRSSEYVLMTDAFFELSGGFPGRTPEARVLGRKRPDFSHLPEARFTPADLYAYFVTGLGGNMVTIAKHWFGRRES